MKRLWIVIFALNPRYSRETPVGNLLSGFSLPCRKVPSSTYVSPTRGQTVWLPNDNSRAVSYDSLMDALDSPTLLATRGEAVGDPLTVFAFSQIVE